MFGTQSGWRIGRLWGIDIRVHYSLLVIALLDTFSVANGLLPYQVPGLNTAVYYAVGLLTALLFIGSVLWHEMAHSLVARRYRIPVVQIVLYLFGGVAQIGRDPERPGQEFWIAIAGPISSVLLAIIFGTLGRMGGLLSAVGGYLGVVNLSLAVFNLLPGFPLDGGRVLRSVLWKWQGSYKRATRQASQVGRIVAGLIAAYALLTILVTGSSANGIWLLLIALFIFIAASQSLYAVRTGPLPAGTPVRRVMRFNVPVVPPDLPLAMLAWKYMDRAPDQAFPVMQNDELLGIVTAAQVDSIPRLEWGKVRVGQLMLPFERLRPVAPDDDIAQALDVMDRASLDHTPVFAAGQLVGMLNRRDIVYRT